MVTSSNVAIALDSVRGRVKKMDASLPLKPYYSHDFQSRMFCSLQHKVVTPGADR